mgnify:CR=1 FL=1
MQDLYKRELSGLRAKLVNQYKGDQLKNFLWFIRPSLWLKIFRMKTNGGITNYFNLSYIKKNNYIFIHIPKAAGRSIQDSILDGQSTSHTSLNMYRIALGEKMFFSCYKFCFVRNPYDRLYSAYRFLKSGGVSRTDRKINKNSISKYPDFNDFVMRHLNEKSIREVVHLIPQTDFITLNEDKLAIDFLGRYENIEEDYFRLCQNLNISPPPTLKWNNKSTAAASVTNRIYTKAMKEHVYNLYKKDFKLLGYEK